MSHLPVTVWQLHEFLSQYHAHFKAWGYRHIRPFDLYDCQDFLEHRPGQIFNVETFYTRSSQVRQVISAIEVNVIVPKKADPLSMWVYQMLRNHVVTYRCYGCNAPIQGNMIARSNRCTRLECQAVVLASA